MKEPNRTIIDISSHKTRLYTLRQRLIYNLLNENDHNIFICSTGKKNIELTKEVQELKVSLENKSYLKNQIGSQFKDLRRCFEDEERV